MQQHQVKSSTSTLTPQNSPKIPSWYHSPASHRASLQGHIHKSCIFTSLSPFPPSQLTGFQSSQEFCSSFPFSPEPKAALQEWLSLKNSHCCSPTPVIPHSHISTLFKTPGARSSSPSLCQEETANIDSAEQKLKHEDSPPLPLFPLPQAADSAKTPSFLSKLGTGTHTDATN